MKYLITGGAGFIDTNASNYFLTKGESVVVLDNFSRKGSTRNTDFLRKLFKSYSFKGKIISNIGSLKPQLSWKDLVFNVMVYAYPLSFFWPLNILFATDYVCIMRNDKK